MQLEKSGLAWYNKQIMGLLNNLHIAFLLAPSQFRDEEYFQPKVILQAKGAHVDTIAFGDPEEMTGTQGGKARTDTLFEALIPNDYDALVIVGGKGSKAYFKNKAVLKLVQQFYVEGKIIGAICSAVGVLAAAELVKGKTVTSFMDEKSLIQTKGGRWQDMPVVTDGQLVTAQAPEAAIAFGEAIAKALVG